MVFPPFGFQGLNFVKLYSILKRMNKYFKSIKNRFHPAFSSVGFRMFVLLAGYASFILFTKIFGRFDFFSGYFYLTLISLAGFWFGIKGGAVAAAVASGIFIAEANFYRYWPFRDILAQTLFLRMLFYFLGGIGMGYVADIERKLEEQLKTLAYYDELTGCVNFRWVMHLLRTEIARARRYGKEMTVSMLDIDHFKKVNDKYGHLTGNDVLREFAVILRDNVRDVDIVGRYGGEEFLIILPEATVEKSLVVLERIRLRLAETKMTSHKLRIKVSAGVVSCPYNGKSFDEILSLVDNALYQAKRTGRNKIVVERRRWLRVNPVKGLRVELVGPSGKKEKGHLEVKNISMGGLLLFCSHEIQKENFLCRVHVHSSEKAVPLEFGCRVIHIMKLKNALYSVGVFFSDISHSEQKKLVRFFAEEEG